MNKRAFSLIELMIVITIIGILAAIAVPSYQDYVVRSKVVEGLSLVRPLQNHVAEYLMVNNATVPNCQADATFTATKMGLQTLGAVGPLSQAIWNHNCYLELYYDNVKLGISGAYLSLVLCPQQTTSGLDWKCFWYSGLDDRGKYAPANCQTRLTAATDCDPTP